jgi:DNA polymerase-3 subunit beta
LNILRALPDGEVEFNQTAEQTFFIKPLFKKIDFQLKTVSSDKYPEITDIDENSYFQIAQNDFLEMINQTIFAISDDESRYFMNGVYMEKIQNKIVMVSTDGRRLSFIERPVDDTILFEQGIIIPPKVLNLVRKMATGEGNVHIAVTDKHIYIKFNNQKLISTLIEGQFPNYKRVIPEKHTHAIMVKKSELAEALKRVSLLVEQKSKRIFMTINSDTITLNSEESDIGKAAEDIACTYDGESAVIALNFQYLADPLKVIHGEEVKIGFTEPNKAITLSGKDEESCFHIVMPMQS